MTYRDASRIQDRREGGEEERERRGREREGGERGKGRGGEEVAPPLQHPSRSYSPAQRPAEIARRASRRQRAGRVRDARAMASSATAWLRARARAVRTSRKLSWKERHHRCDDADGISRVTDSGAYFAERSTSTSGQHPTDFNIKTKWRCLAHIFADGCDRRPCALGSSGMVRDRRHADNIISLVQHDGWTSERAC